MNQQIEDAFKSNPIIKTLTDNISNKLNNIPIEQLYSEKEYYENIKQEFGNVQLKAFFFKIT